MNLHSVRRAALALALAIHALAHALAGMRILDRIGGLTGEPPVPLISLLLVTALLTVAMAGTLAAAMGAAGARPFRAAWREYGLVALGTSAVLLVSIRPYGYLWGLLINVAFSLVLYRAAGWTPARPVAARRRAAALRDAAAILVVTYAAVAVAVRPWHSRWGSTTAELAMELPGDELNPREATYGIQHAVTIAAPPARVWPWLAQLGTDRGGFYSYAALENMVGLDVTNADRIHPEWQDVATRRFILATPRGWMGLDRELGWDVPLVQHERLLVLQSWGSFVLLPRPDGTTRFIVRTRGAQPNSIAGTIIAPFAMLLFEPIHFLMERRMMLGVKQRAEATP